PIMPKHRPWPAGNPPIRADGGVRLWPPTGASRLLGSRPDQDPADDAGKKEQILSMAPFMCSSGANSALKHGDRTSFARRYNGSAFFRNRYHEMLAAAHNISASVTVTANDPKADTSNQRDKNVSKLCSIGGKLGGRMAAATGAPSSSPQGMSMIAR